MDLKEVFGSARAEHEPDHPTPAARPILIAEDDSAIGRLLVPMLGVRDHASAAATGVFAPSLKDHDPDASVVLLTGWGERGAGAGSAAAGMLPIIMKPVNREQSFEMPAPGDPRVREFSLEASCPRS